VIRGNKKPFNLRVAVLAVLCAGLVVFSAAWYHTLVAMDCRSSNKINSGQGASGDGGSGDNCIEQLDFHWIKFYGINSFIYGVSALAIVLTVRKKRDRNDS